MKVNPKNFRKGFYGYCYEAFSHLSAFRFKVRCERCDAEDATRIKRKADGTKGWGCLQCGTVRWEDEKDPV